MVNDMMERWWTLYHTQTHKLSVFFWAHSGPSGACVFPSHTLKSLCFLSRRWNSFERDQIGRQLIVLYFYFYFWKDFIGYKISDMIHVVSKGRKVYKEMCFCCFLIFTAFFLLKNKLKIQALLEILSSCVFTRTMWKKKVLRRLPRALHKLQKHGLTNEGIFISELLLFVWRQMEIVWQFCPVLSVFSFSICKGRSCRGHVCSRCPTLVHTWPCIVSRPDPLDESAGWWNKWCRSKAEDVRILERWDDYVDTRTHYTSILCIKNIKPDTVQLILNLKIYFVHFAPCSRDEWRMEVEKSKVLITEKAKKKQKTSNLQQQIKKHLAAGQWLQTPVSSL